MYEAFYKLNEKPFSLSPDPQFLFMGKEHDLGLSVLQYALETDAGFAVLTGEVGVGKTSLIRYLLKHIDKSFVVGTVSNTNVKLASIIEWVADAFNVDTSKHSGVNLYNAIIDTYIQYYAEGKRALLIVDEAQNLDEESLEALRLISNVNTDQHQLLQVILAGQPELRTLLQRPSLRQFAQRISIDYHLNRLSVSQVNSYIKHRLKVAGASRMLFDKKAVGRIAYHSEGIPRLINNIADLGLVYGYARKLPIVTDEVIQEVIKDRDKQGILPTKKPISTVY